MAGALCAGAVVALLILYFGPRRSGPCFEGPPGAGFVPDMACVTRVVPFWPTMAIGAAVTCAVYGLVDSRRTTR